MTATAPFVTQLSLQGRYAGAVSRLVAFAADATVTNTLFLLALASVSYGVSVITGKTITWSRDDLVVGVIYVGWEFVYYAYSWAASGKTFGMALLGVRVVDKSGAQVRPREAIVRTLALPLSFLLLGLGFLGILVQRDRRALHDLIAGTAVVYDWDARAARLRFLARRSREPGAGVGDDGPQASRSR
jgi:uncharacterized RDD family membrane protein YckC